MNIGRGGQVHFLIAAAPVKGTRIYLGLEAMQRQANFVANASHEFRTPLAVLKTALDCSDA